jgi:hypothetical protein
MINLLPTEKQKDPRYLINHLKPVKVYRNLHKNCYSVQQDGLVKGHFKKLAIKNPMFLVRTIGKELVRKTKRKNVHAFVIGYLEDFVGLRAVAGDCVTYNPYKNDSFVYKDTGNPVKKTKYADFFFSTEGKAIVKVER